MTATYLVRHIRSYLLLSSLALGLALAGASSLAAEPPTVQPASRQNVTVFNEPGRYGGWPANHGLWQLGDEVVVGFTAAWFKHATSGHAVDRSRPFRRTVWMAG